VGKTSSRSSQHLETEPAGIASQKPYALQ